MGRDVCLIAANFGIAVRLIAPQISPVQRLMLHRAFCSCVYGCLPLSLSSLRLSRLHAQLVADELEGGGDGLVHVVVLVTAQATGEDHVALLNVSPNSMNSLYIIDCIAAYKAIYTYILVYKSI